MITDFGLQLDAANATIRAAATYLSTNTIDLGVAKRDIATGDDMFILFSVDVAFAGGTSVQPQIITSASANLSTPSVLASGPAIPEAALTLGATFWMPMAPRLTPGPGVASTAQRYLGVQYIGVGTHTAGSISSRLVYGEPRDVTYLPSGFTSAV
jgi:hypothetical protein